MPDREDYTTLLAEARKAAEKSYCPYSGKGKGAAVLGENGEIYTGVKVECAAFGSAVSAEVGAVTSALAAGCQRFAAIAIHPPDWPSGNARQLLREFGTTTDVVVARSDGNVEVRSLEELLPHSFGPESL